MAQTAECGAFDFGCKMGEGLKNLADSAITDFVKSLYDGAVAFVAQVSTFWMDSPSPDVANGAVLSLRADMSWYVAGFAILGFLVGLVKLVLSQDVKGSLIGIATPIVNLILATAAYATGIGLLLTASDEFSKWIVERSTGGEIDLTQMLTTSSALLASPGTAFLLYILLLLGAVINLLFMYFRDVMFLILSAFIVVLAAASGSEQGRQAWRKANGWLIALLLFKPVAAGIYSLGFRMLVSGSAGDGKESSIPEAMHSTLVALLILLLAALALPALIKFIVPAAGVGAGAFSGGAALGAGVTLAAGAAVLATGGAGAVAGGAASAGRGAAAGAGASAASSGGGATAGGASPNGGSGGSSPGSGGGNSGGGSGASETISGTDSPSGSSAGGGSETSGSSTGAGASGSSDSGATAPGGAATSAGSSGDGSSSPKADAASSGSGSGPSGANASTGGHGQQTSSGGPSGSSAPRSASTATQKMGELSHLAQGANPNRLVEEGDE